MADKRSEAIDNDQQLSQQQQPLLDASYPKQPPPYAQQNPQQQHPQQQYPQQPYPQQQFPQQPYPQQQYPQQPLYPQQQLVAVQYASGPQQIVYTPGAVGRGPQQLVIQHQQPESYIGHIVLAILTIFCCCGCICGGVAICFANRAKEESVKGNAARARTLGRKSLGCSVACLIVGGVLCFVIPILYIVVPLAYLTYAIHMELLNANATLNYPTTTAGYI